MFVVTLELYLTPYLINCVYNEYANIQIYLESFLETNVTNTYKFLESCDLDFL